MGYHKIGSSLGGIMGKLNKSLMGNNRASTDSILKFEGEEEILVGLKDE